MQATGRFVVAIGLGTIAVALSRTALAGDDGPEPGADIRPHPFSDEAGGVALDDEVLKSRASGVAIWRKGDGRLEVSHTPDFPLGLLTGPSPQAVAPLKAPSPADTIPISPPQFIISGPPPTVPLPRPP